MVRFPPASERVPSQRGTAEMREQLAANAELKRQLDTATRELGEARSYRNSADERVRALEKEIDDVAPPSLHGRCASIKKLAHGSNAYYDHVDFLYKCLRRFDSDDVTALWVAALKKLQLEREEKNDLRERVLKESGMRPAVEKLKHEVDAESAKHLRSSVYTTEHFSVLRLVAKMSKRVCGLVEQSIKYQHNADGTKKRQMMRPGSTVPAPSLFDIAGITEVERAAMEETKLELNDHADRHGADICGKPHALDRAIYDSLGQLTRSGGLATDGKTPETAHLVCVTGDGAGLTMGKSGVRVAHFIGSTNLLNQSSSDVVNWLFYKASSKAEDYTVLESKLVNIIPDLLYTGSTRLGDSLPTASTPTFTSSSCSSETSPSSATSAACSLTTPTHSARHSAAAAIQRMHRYLMK